MTVPAKYTLTEAHFIIAQQEKALRMIGYSATTGQPRFGPKAQCARWGLGEDTLPEEYASLGRVDEKQLWLERFAWVKDRYGYEPRITGDCECGRQLDQSEYSYYGGSHGIYLCSECGRRYMVDLNGVMWQFDEERVGG